MPWQYPLSSGSSRAATVWAASWQSGRYYYPDSSSGASTVALTKDTERARLFVPPSSVTLTSIGAQVTSAGDVGSKVRFGFRQDDGTGRPSTLLLDCGVIAGDSVSVQEIAISQAVVAGVTYWATSTSQIVTVTAPTVDVCATAATPMDVGTSAPVPNSNNFGRSQASITGALPAAWTDAGTTSNVTRVFVKVA